MTEGRHGPGPRERLWLLGPRALSDEELIALLLGSGGASRGARQLARKLLRSLSSLRQLARATAPELTREPGIGTAKAAALVAAFEMGRRVAGTELEAGRPIGGPERVFEAFHARVRDARQESLWVLLLDGRHCLVRETEVSRGTLTASLIHPREVFGPALREAAAAVVLVHNHPSGDPSPSAEDVRVSRRLARAGALLGIPLLDHVVVAERGHASLRERGLIESALAAGN